MTLPSTKGCTEFASLVAAYETLPAPRRAVLAGLVVEHTLAHSRRNLLPAGATSPTGPRAPAAADSESKPHSKPKSRSESDAEPKAKETSFLAIPPQRHPLLRTIPETGATALHVGSFSQRVVGQPEAEGRCAPFLAAKPSAQSSVFSAERIYNCAMWIAQQY